jgi:hypothetical protein
LSVPAEIMADPPGRVEANGRRIGEAILDFAANTGGARADAPGGG